MYSLVLRVFQNFAAVGNAPAVAVVKIAESNIPLFEEPPTAAEVEAQGSETDGDVELQTKGRFLAAGVLEALVQTRMPIPAFELDFDLGATPLGMQEMMTSGLQIDHLGTVKLIVPGTCPHDLAPSCEILDLVRLASNLESLHLGWSQDYRPYSEEPILRTLITGLATCRLRSLALLKVILSSAALLSALQSISASLCKLELVDVRLIEPATLDTLLLWMARNLQLEEVGCIRLRSMHNWTNVVWRVGEEDDSFAAKGHTAVKAALEDAAHSGQFVKMLMSRWGAVEYFDSDHAGALLQLYFLF